MHTFYSNLILQFQLWKHPFAQVIFDSDPAPKGTLAPSQMEEMSQAMIRLGTVFPIFHNIIYL